MTALTIQVRDKDRDLFGKLAKRPDVKIVETIEETTQPNAVTKKAISHARSGKTTRMDNVDLFFKNF